MNRALLFGLVIFLAMVGISLVGGEQQAVAGHGCHGCYGGYSCHGCYGCYASSCYGCYGGCYARPRRVRHRRAYASCYGGCYAYSSCYGGYGCSTSYGCYGGGCYSGGYSACYGGGYSSYGCSSGCYSGYGTGVGSYGSAAPGTIISPSAPSIPPSAPAAPTPSIPQVDPPVPSAGGATAQQSNLLTVRVPDGAKVIINGHETSSTGTNRQFVAKGLTAGKTYQYEVRAQIEGEGDDTSETKVIKLAAGGTAELVFEFDAPPVATVAGN